MRDTIEEQWRPVEGYEGLYEVSTLGRVRSLDRIDRLGRLKPGVILKPRMNTWGYLRVGLYKEGKVKRSFVHRLVAHAFIPNPEGLPEINHRDENPKNNVVFLKDDGSVDKYRSNLEWCDRKYNINYGTRTERAKKNMVQTRISNGTYDPEMCGVWNRDEKEYYRLRMRKYRLKKKQEKKKNNRPSGESLW